MDICILFGLPGAGKSYVGKIFEEYFGFYFYEGDNDLTEEMKEAIATKTPFTDAMRDVFFQKLIEKVKKLTTEKKKIVVAQTFIKEKYRTILLDAIPKAKFIYIYADDEIREQRLANRIEYPLDISYARTMKENFESPKLQQLILDNNTDGTESVIGKIRLLIRRGNPLWLP